MMPSSKPQRWSRRRMLGGSLIAALGPLLSAGLRATEVDPVDAAVAALRQRALITKPIPATGERLPAIGIGTNAFRAADYPQLRAVLLRLQQSGGTVIDTADDYPNPSSEESEAVIGRALADLGIRGKMFLATKFNAEGGQPPTVPRDKIFGRDAFERSLQRLQTDHIDLQYVHHYPSIDALMPLLQELKRARKVRYIGLSTLHAEEHAEISAQMRKYSPDFVEVNYSLGSREAEDSVLRTALEHRIAVMVDVPLGGRRGSLLKEVGDRPLPPWARDIEVSSWSQFFLKYVISHPAVTCAIPGSTQVEHVLDNQLAGRGRLPDAAMRKKMEDYWNSITKP